TFKGETLNALLEAARLVGKQFTPPAIEQPPEQPAEQIAQPVQVSGTTDLERIVLETFEELRRGKYADSGLVPIHEVRAVVRTRQGDAAAQHDVFDEVVLGLMRAKKLRLAPIADPSRVEPQQLQDAIAGVGETLFYLEPVHELAPVG